MLKLLNHFYKSIFILLFCALSGLVFAQEPLGEIYDTQTNQMISAKDLVSFLKQADVVMIGERHDRPVHHQIENWLLLQTEKEREHGSVVLEMLDSSQQKSITEVQQWLLSGGKVGARSLMNKIDWNEAWNQDMYRDVMNQILRGSASVWAGNPTIQEVKKLGSYLPKGKVAGNSEVRKALLEIMESNHPATEAMVSMQQWKDHSMAEALLAAPKPAWLLAGAVHTSKQLGVPLFLQDAHYKGRLKVVMIADKDNKVDRKHADYIWYVANAESAQNDEKKH